MHVLHTSAPKANILNLRYFVMYAMFHRQRICNFRLLRSNVSNFKTAQAILVKFGSFVRSPLPYKFWKFGLKILTHCGIRAIFRDHVFVRRPSWINDVIKTLPDNIKENTRYHTNVYYIRKGSLIVTHPLPKKNLRNTLCS